MYIATVKNKVALMNRASKMSLIPSKIVIKVYHYEISLLLIGVGC
jgi:hypothetical protein